MVDWADDLKKKLGQNAPPPKKEEGGASLSSSVRQAGETVQESEKQLEKLAEKKARLLESISKKVETLKSLVSQASEATENGMFVEAEALWKQVLELDPQNADALVGVDLCQSRLAELAPPADVPVTENPVTGMLPSTDDIPAETVAEAVPVELPVADIPAPPPLQEIPVETPMEPVAENPIETAIQGTEEPEIQLQPPPLSDLPASASEAPPVPADSMSQNDLDALISKISETPPQSSETPLSSSELTQVLESIQGDPVPPPKPQEAPVPMDLPKSEEPIAAVPVPEPEIIPDPMPVAEVPEPSAPTVENAASDEDEGAKELEAVLKEVNQTQMQALASAPPQIDQTDVMGGATPAPMTADTKESTAKLDQIKAAIPAQTQEPLAPPAPLPPAGKRKPWVLALCLVLLVLLTAALVNVVLSMFETHPPQASKVTVHAEPTFTVEEALTQGEKYLKSGKIQDAMTSLLQIKDMYPTPSKMVDDWLRAGQAVYDHFLTEKSEDKKKELLSAVTKIYEQLIDQFPRDEKIASAYYRTAECYASQGAYSRAFSYYDALIKYYPDFQNLEEAVYSRARMLLEQEKFQECREAYLKIIKDFPHSKMSKWAELDIAKSYKMEVLKGGQSPV